MRPFPALQVMTQATDEQHAGQLLIATMALDSWIGGRALPPAQDQREAWQVQAFLDARDVPADAPLPESVRRVVVPLSQAKALGIDLRRLTEYVAYSCTHTRQTHMLWGRSCCPDCWGLGVELWRARRAAQRPRETAVGLDG
jgi:hypothetical protein